MLVSDVDLIVHPCISDLNKEWSEAAGKEFKGAVAIPVSPHEPF